MNFYIILIKINFLLQYKKVLLQYKKERGNLMRKKMKPIMAAVLAASMTGSTLSGAGIPALSNGGGGA